MENNKIKIYGLIGVFILAVVFYLGSWIGYDRGSEKGYEKARTEIKSRLEEKNLIGKTSDEMFVLSGVVTSMQADRFILESRLPYDPTLSDKEQARVVTKTVLVVGTTEIFERNIEINKGSTSPGEPIRPFVVKNIKVSIDEISVGDQVVVEAAENVASKSQFEARSIFKNSQ